MKKIQSAKIFLLAMIAASAACAKKERGATFADVCQSENQTPISIRGFLKVPTNAAAQNFLLVENENGTGGFIQIETPDQKDFSNNVPVKLTGEVLKTQNSCVLKLTKIETP
ncbi:MAG TPA: hypothetical protein PKE69_07365 [Pyrinomonadaceae bacterium]|nr:hypothetical protein [Pyrinomonadaceae bacterium]